MLWNKARRSENINDTRKGKDARTLTGKNLGAGLAAVVLSGAALHSTFNALPSQDSVEDQVSQLIAPNDDPQLRFIESILGDTEDTWKQLFAKSDRHYPAPTLTLFSDGVASGCGFSAASSGPFYCPENQQLYLDPAFFEQMAQRYSVVGDFAQSFVIAHEVGHHVQLELGLSAAFETALSARLPVTGDAGLKVRAELQADCLAGVWAHHAQQRLAWLEPGDIDGALNAAATFGDDYLQRAQNQTVRPETFSHGTSQQRSAWFSAGFDSGRIDACATFNAAQL
ncbi:KPN_02809 family neutral zinc metallopeptidase [Pseudomonas sp. TH15]|uniref:KPN_02809 family neutral zinc metallopeptidase n=1 Tax=Pseudomonas sp. TH15 TaxID=2796381 RepID=UPI001911CA6E|nr:neutral zinc metallopeptidase [Pseudomonas sp. TH15]MBK5508683.1 neutral zinc metallopeptidase [Pseudomonas sp. TH15]